ncbi:MFS transporter [Pseudonocardia sulfidoxydans NBRC 16205]|uniref:MFS transporter n=1 Tax=Pseudonocardia sulfidoxydans NBRC 16205 TaxID=1223511 RepID=A0A511D926_9PSEU|nr:MFS transporter [Pseudonocardia sulfidoxydans]GEL21276.1 MFS transporter [Pseudonocardia sulfidoxydans NBRC 16205]
MTISTSPGIVTPRLRTARRATAAAFAAQGFLFAVLLTHLPQFEQRHGIDDGTVTLVVLGVSLLAGVGSVVAEALARRRGSAVALTAGLVTIVAATLAIALAPDVAVLFVGFGCYGLGLGAVDAGSNMQAVAVQRGYGRSILTSFHAWWSGAGIVGALWVALSARIGLSLPVGLLIAAAVAALLAAFARRGILPGRELPAPVTGTTGPAVAVVPWRPVLLLGSAMACFYVADAAVSNWSALYLHDLLGAAAGTAALGFAAYQGAALTSRAAGDQLVRRIGAVATVRIGALVGIGGFVLAVLASNAGVAIAGFALVGLGLPVVAPLCFSAAGALAPGATDAVIARVNVFNYLGAVVGGVAVGLVGTTVDLRAGFVVPLVLAIALVVLARGFVPHTAVAHTAVAPTAGPQAAVPRTEDAS